MNKELKADISLFFVTVAWGSSFPIVSLALKSFPPYSFVMLRYLLASVILLIICFKKLKNINKETVIAGLLVGLTVFLGTIFQTAGLLYTTPSKSGFLTGLNVAIVPVLIAIIYKKLPDNKTVIGVIFSIIGLGVMSINSNMTLNFGDAITIMGAFMFSVQILLVDKYAHKVDLLLFTFVEFFATGIFSIIPSGLIEHFNFRFSSVSIFGIVFTAIFCTVVAYSIQNKMQPYTSPAHAAVIYLGEPVFGAIFSSFIGDRLTGRTLIGCGLIFTGMVVINLRVVLSRAKARTRSRIKAEVNK
jgi:drug/metabolite transporter (DMT)-like permease